MKRLFRVPLLASLLFAVASWTAVSSPSSVGLEKSDSSTLTFRLDQVGVPADVVADGAELHADTILCKGAAADPLTTTCTVNFDGDKQTRIQGDKAAELKRLLLRSLGANGPAVEPEHVLASDVVCMRGASSDSLTRCTLSMIRPVASEGLRVAVAYSDRD